MMNWTRAASSAICAIVLACTVTPGTVGTANAAAAPNILSVSPSVGRYSEDPNFVYYFPAGYRANARLYPVIVTFNPGGAVPIPGPYNDQLRAVADKHKFIVMSSKYYHNLGDGQTLVGGAGLGMTFNSRGVFTTIGAGYANARAQLRAAFARLPIDKTRVVLMGASGGGSFSHALNIRYPGIAAAVVINTGMIWGEEIDETTQLGSGTYNGPDWFGYMRSFRRTGNYHRSRKLAIFFESPTDFRYAEMLADVPVYRSAGWNVTQLNFAGGHTMAPTDLYNTAFDQLVARPRWRRT